MLGSVHFPLDGLVLDDMPQFARDERQQYRRYRFLFCQSTFLARMRSSQLTSVRKMRSSVNGTLNSVGSGVMSSESLYGLKYPGPVMSAVIGSMLLR
jgi:hypothetical protein